jgi:hypothetical protein
MRTNGWKAADVPSQYPHMAGIIHRKRSFDIHQYGAAKSRMPHKGAFAS